MASILVKLLASLSPPPVVSTSEYDGLEYKWKFLVFRPALFRNEVFLLAGLLIYVAFIWYGKSVNASIVKKWFDTHLPILEEQFSKPLGKSGITADGYTDYFTYSTGRRNAASLHTILSLRPRHDFFQWIFQTGRTLVDLQYRPRDEIQLDFKLAPGVLPHDFVWALVHKDELLNIRDDRWDLTFTKTSDVPSIPAGYSVMSEFADITENIFLKTVGDVNLRTIFNNPKVLLFFRSLSVTDQPRDRPAVPIPIEKREKHVILSIIPPSNPKDAVDLVNAVFHLIDSLNKLNLRPETKHKLKKIREDLDKEIKEDSEREKKEELSQAVEDRKIAKKRAEEERIAKLSASEQRKILEKERKRTMRKTQGKVVRK